MSNIDFKVYPNPNQGRFVVQSSSFDGKCTIEILDVAGKLMVHRTQLGGMAEGVIIELDNMPSGMYFVRVHAPQGVGMKRIVVE